TAVPLLSRAAGRSARSSRVDRHTLQPTTHSESWSGTHLPQQPPLGTPGECREALGHILQVMDGVVQEVAPKRFDGEARTVGTRPGPLPLVVAHAVEGGGEVLARHHQGLAYCRRIVLPVALRDGGGVLIPVGEGRIVLRQHQPEALLEQHKHVADVAGIFEGGPDGPPRRRSWRTLAPKRATAARRPARVDRRPHGGTNHVARDRPRIKTTGRTRTFENPRPILVIGSRVLHGVSPYAVSNGSALSGRRQRGRNERDRSGTRGLRHVHGSG